MVFAVEDACAGGAVEFVAGEGIEVAVEVLDVDWHMGDGLAAVDKEEGADIVSHGGHFLDWIDGAEDIGHVSDGDEFDFVV